MEHLLTADILEKNKRSNFYYSFLLLPKPKREAINVVYAWCRVADDIVDEENTLTQKQKHLRWWAKEFDDAIRGVSRHPIVNKLVDIVRHFKIPLHHFHDLIKGMEMDLVKNRYASFEELKIYCYRVASTVGLISTEIFGYKHNGAKEYAVNLGIALQLTNILRDVSVDAEKNRIYLPAEDLQRFGYSEEELLAGTFNPQFQQLMNFEAKRAKQYFNQAILHLSEEDKPLFIAALIMQEIYLQILFEIEKIHYNVFFHRIRISKFKKLMIAFRVWRTNRKK